jgi:SAM-dependent methyltransferase
VTPRTLGTTFDDVPNLYHRMRPRYPAAWFDRLGDLLPETPRVLEIGAGTGIATAEMTGRGWIVDAIEPGAGMIAVGREVAPQATFIESGFEAFEGQPGSYDAIVSCTAFHWIDRDVRHVKSARLLKPGGLLAVIHYRHIAGSDDALFESLQECYQAHMPDDTAEEKTLPPQGSRTQAAREMRRSGLFEIVHSDWQVEITSYPTARYLDLLRTYSGHRWLGDGGRERLLACIAAKIDAAGGIIRKAHQHEIVIGRRREG